MNTRIFTTLLALITVAVLTGCNTMAGIGKDVEKSGEAIQKAATK